MDRSLVSRFLREEDGQDMVEYSLLLAFLGLAAITALGTVKTTLSIVWANIHSSGSVAHRRSL